MGRTVPMLAPDGSIGDVPEENVQQAIKDGMKLGVDLVSPDGQHGTVPMGQASEAIKHGFTLLPPSVPTTSVSMHTVGLMDGREQNDAMNFRPIAAEATPEGHAAGIATREAAEPVVTALGHVGAGGLKGAAEGALGIDNLVRKGLNYPIQAVNAVAGDNTIKPYDMLSPKDFGADENALEAKNTGEVIGKVGETVLEFIYGEGELKALTETEKLGKLAKFAKEYPKLMNVLRQTLVGAGQGTLHSAGANPDSGLGENLAQGGVEGLVAGGVGAASEGISRLFRKGIDFAAKQYTRNVISKTPAVAPEALLENAARDITGTATGKALNRETDASIRTIFEDGANAVKDKAKELFQQVDDATGGKLSPVQAELRDLTMQLRGASSDEEIAALMKQRAIKEAEQEALFTQAEQANVPRQTINRARSLYKQYSAMEDVDYAIKMSTSGISPNMRLGYSGSPSTPETIDPKKLLGRLQKLYDAGRLQDAFGADKLLKDGSRATGHIKAIMHVLDIGTQTAKAAAFQETLAHIGKYIASGALGAVGGAIGYQHGGITGAAEYAAGGLAVPVVFSKLMSSPHAMKLLETGLSKGIAPVKLAPAVAAAVLAESNVTKD